MNAVAPPVISVYSQASAPLGLNLPMLVDALQQYADQFVVPAWGTPAKLQCVTVPAAGTWPLILMDDADAPGALAYHTVGPDGLPILKVFVRTIQQAGESLSAAISHELVEALVDPNCERTFAYPGGMGFGAYEAADPVEETTFMVDGYPMSDFVFPAYFDPTSPAGAKLDQCGAVTRPLELSKGGYQTVCQAGQWTEVFGSADKALRFWKEDRRGHRSEYRRARLP